MNSLFLCPQKVGIPVMVHCYGVWCVEKPIESEKMSCLTEYVHVCLHVFTELCTLILPVPCKWILFTVSLFILCPWFHEGCLAVVDCGKGEDGGAAWSVKCFGVGLALRRRPLVAWRASPDWSCLRRASGGQTGLASTNCWIKLFCCCQRKWIGQQLKFALQFY